MAGRRRSPRPRCETPGCGKPIPVGGEGSPEICPDCLRAQAEDAKVRPSYYKGDAVMRVIETFGLGFRLGTVVKYVLRAGSKGEAVVDLKKARWYLDREIAALEGRLEEPALPRA